MLSKKNSENEKLQESNKDADMKMFELEQKCEMMEAEKDRTVEELK